MPNDEWQSIGGDDGWQDIGGSFDTSWQPIDYNQEEFNQASQVLQNYEPLQPTYTPSSERDYSNSNIWQDIIDIPSKVDEMLPVGPGEIGQTALGIGKGLWNIISTSVDERVPDFDPTSRQSALEQMDRDSAHFWDRIDPFVQSLTNPFKKAYYGVIGDKEKMNQVGADSKYQSQGFIKDVWHTLTSPEASGLWELGTTPSRFIAGLANPEKGLTPIESGIHGVTKGLTYDEEAQLIRTPLQAMIEGKSADEVVVKPDTWQDLAIGGTLSLGDPAAWLTGELVGRGLGLVSKPIAKGIGKGLNWAVEKEFPYVSEGIKQIGQTFSKTAFRSPEYIETMNIVDRELRKKGFSIPEVAENLKKFDDVLDDIAKQAGKPRDSINELFLGMERKYKPGSMPTEVVAGRELTPDEQKLHDAWLEGSITDEEAGAVGVGHEKPWYKLSHQMNDPYIDPSPIDLSKPIRISRGSQVDPMEMNGKRGLAFGISEEGSYHTNAIGEDIQSEIDKRIAAMDRGEKVTPIGLERSVGGPNRISFDYYARNPLVITQGNVAGPATLEKFLGKNYVDYLGQPPEWLQNQIGRKSFGVPDFVAKAKGWEKMVGEEALPRMEDVFKNQLGFSDARWKQIEDAAKRAYAIDGSYEAYSVFEDALAYKLAKENGYDAIISLAKHSDVTDFGEVVLLDDIAEMANKGTLPEELFKNSPLELQVKAVNAQMERLGNRMPDGLVKAALEMKAYREEMFAKAKEAGIDIAPLADEDLDYFLHMRTKEATKILQQNRPDIFWKGSRDIDPAHGSAITRKWKGMDINTLNELGRKGRLPGLEGLKFEKFFENDPVQLEFYRQMRDVNNIADVSAIYDAVKSIGTDIKGWSPQKIASSGLLPLSAPGDNSPLYSAIYKEIKNLGVPTDVKAFLENRVRLLSAPDPGNAVRNFFKGIRDVWAHSTLNYAPSYVLRNELGNILNNSYSGMGFNLRWYEDADRLMQYAKRAKLEPEVLAEGINGKTVGEWLDELKEMGVYGGWSTAERLQVQRAKFAEKFREKLPGLMNVNRNMENNARIAQYMFQRIENGVNPINAQAAVDKYLFPYITGLTERERMVQEVIPFYAWSRFNIPLQIQAALGMTPKRTQFNALSSVVNYLHWREPASEMDRGMQQYTPDYMQELAGVPVKRNDNGTMMFALFGTFVPFAELAQLTTKQGALSKVLNLLHPVASELGIQLLNTDENGRQLFDEFGDNSVKLVGAGMSRRMKHVLTRVRILGDLDRAMQGYYEDPDAYTPTQKSFFQKASQLIFGITTSNVDYYKEMKKVNWQMKRHKALWKQYLKQGDEAAAEEQFDMWNDMMEQYYGQ